MALSGPAKADVERSYPNHFHHWVFLITLAYFQEPSLSSGEDRNQIRFVWERSFHPPVVIRADLHTRVLTLKELARLGPSAGKLTINRQVQLGDADMTRLREIFDMLGNCIQPVSANGFDGATWIFEYRDDDTYCLVDQWTPSHGPWHDAGRSLIEIAGYGVAEEDIY